MEVEVSGDLNNRRTRVTIICSKLGSLTVAAVWLTAAVLSGADAGAMLSLVFWLGLALALIWFPDELGSINRSSRRRYGYHIDNESPPIMLLGFGWFFLVGLPLVRLLIHLLGI